MIMVRFGVQCKQIDGRSIVIKLCPVKQAKLRLDLFGGWTGSSKIKNQDKQKSGKLD